MSLSNLSEIYMSSVYPIDDNDLCRKDNDFVYVFYNNVTKLSKIGVTTSPYRRFGQIRTSCGSELTFLIAIEMGKNYDENSDIVERFLHTFYKNKRVVGEWFNLSYRDLLDIEDLFFGAIEGGNILQPFRDKRFKLLGK